MEENRKTELMNLAGRLERLRRLMGQDMPHIHRQKGGEERWNGQPFIVDCR